MKIVLVSNFLNHHMLPICLELQKRTNNNFTFIATEPVPHSRKQLGYADMNEQYSFVLNTYQNKENEIKARKICDESDFVIDGMTGSTFIRDRIEHDKLTAFYSERLYKTGYIGSISGKGICVPWPNFLPYSQRNWIWKKYLQYDKYKNVKMLCASAYTAGDLALSRAFLGRTYKWGYFPEVKQYESIKAIIDRKLERSILWVGRLIELKHPESVLYLAKELRNSGITFSLKIIGIGPLEEKIQRYIDKNDLSGCVNLTGAMTPEQVRMEMERAEIFVFSSDYHEGWGAVLNEAMNSGCAVVTNTQIGSVPFVIKDGVNGLIYRSRNDLVRKVEQLLEDGFKRKTIGEKAYETLVNHWNPSIAAERILNLAEHLNNGEETEYNEGPCSVAKVLLGGRLFETKKERELRWDD